jgi:hypothetical protein
MVDLKLLRSRCIRNDYSCCAHVTCKATGWPS